ncbi:MAG TPA: DUF6390 family protein [Acidimicrobiales bacterium]|nr:DUF6390 family protein [Acidimicrobiales bacterium]
MTETGPALPGPVLFARYAYPPNELGYCGPDDPQALLEMVAGQEPVSDLAHLAARFEGAWPYLQLIASCNGIDSPLDPRVVHAYWVGNELLTRVPAPALARSLADRFEERAGRRFTPLVRSAWKGVPQHNLHVFAVYPWLGLLRAGMEGPPLEVLDRCRIRVGRVRSVDGDMVEVAERPLAFRGSCLVPGPPRSARARCRLDGLGLVGGLRPGDLVALHWDWVCDRLSAEEAGWLTACDRRNLAAVNGTAWRGPATACGA